MKTPTWAQVKYAKIFLSTLPTPATIKNNSPFLANCRCMVCGDSMQNQHKKRMYIYEKQGLILAYCQNCGHSSSLEALLRTHAEHLYKQLLVERFRFSGETYTPPKKVEAKKQGEWKSCLTMAAMAPKAAQYLAGRQVPKNQWHRLYYTSNMRHSYIDICDELHIEPAIDKNIPEIEGIFFPFYHEGSLVFSATRNIDTSSTLRYVTLEYQPAPKIFGLELVDTSKKVVVVEGPMDSLFVKNCVATSDASLTKVSSVISRDSLILFPDNEPRHPVQTKRIGKFVKEGYEVVLLPHSIKEKDPNDLAKAGYDIEELITKYSVKGLQAKLAFNTWDLT